MLMLISAIAIPTFLNQRNKGYDAQAKTDARNMQIAAETAFTDVQKYPTALTAGTDYKKSPSPIYGRNFSFAASPNASE